MSLKPAPETYDLSVPSQAAGIAGSSQAQILVPETTALAALNSERIVVMNGSRVSYYPDAQWTDRLPKVLQTKIIQTFDASKRARAAGRPGEGLSIDYQLLTEVRAFQYDSGGDRSAHVEIYAKVLNDRNGRVVAAKLFTASVPVQTDSAPAVVNALDAGLNQVLLELVSWTLSRV
jgi:cholesterol transport system auxiliary component